MTDATFVEDAASWARSLTKTEVRGPGDMEGAWRRLENRHDIPWRLFWALRYRRPKRIAASLYFRLMDAWNAEQERQLRRLKHELEITKATAGPDHPAVGAVQALVGEDDDAEDSVA